MESAELSAVKSSVVLKTSVLQGYDGCAARRGCSALQLKIDHEATSHEREWRDTKYGHGRDSVVRANLAALQNKRQQYCQEHLLVNSEKRLQIMICLLICLFIRLG